MPQHYRPTQPSTLAHQVKWASTLLHEAQLNCTCKTGVKDALLAMMKALNPPRQQPFLLEPGAIFVGRHKITLDSGPLLPFAPHEIPFDKIIWEDMHHTLNHEVHHLVALWACNCKHIMSIMTTNAFLKSARSRQQPAVPAAAHCRKTAEHTVHCKEEGHIKTFRQRAHELETWLGSADTDPTLLACLMEFVRRQGYKSMEECCIGLLPRHLAMVRSQDTIGWSHFLKGMISKGILAMQAEYLALKGLRLTFVVGRLASSNTSLRLFMADGSIATNRSHPHLHSLKRGDPA